MSETTWETIIEQYKERAVRDCARIEELKHSTNHWHDTAQMLKVQRDQAEAERDKWEQRSRKLLWQRKKLRAERDALRKALTVDVEATP